MKDKIKKFSCLMIVCSIVVMFNFIPSVQGTNGEQGWQRIYGGIELEWETPCILLHTEDGGYVMAGTGTDYSTTVDSIWIVKVDLLGNIEWQKNHKFEADGYFSAGVQAFIATSDGQYLLAGNSYVNEPNALLLKVDENGDEVWHNFYGDDEGLGDDEIFYDVIETSEGYVIVGTTQVGMVKSRDDDTWLVKTDKQGEVIFKKYYDTVEQPYEEGRNIVLIEDGYLIQSDGFGVWPGENTPGEPDVATPDPTGLLKVDTNGNLVWNITYPWGQAASLITKTVDGGLLFSIDNGLIKTDNFGTKIWNYTTASEHEHYFESAIETEDGDIVATGSLETGQGDTDLFMLCLDGEGNYRWESIFEKPRGQNCNSVIQTIDGGFAMLGSTVDEFQIGTFWLIKTDAAGVIPEFSSWIIFFIFSIATLLIVVYRMKMVRQKNARVK